jgi:hypothetical protein
MAAGYHGWMNTLHRQRRRWLGLLTVAPLLPLLAAGRTALAANAAAGRVQVAGQWFDGTAQVAGASLLLNGTGVRQVAWFKGFAAGLYLPARASSAEQALSQSGPKRLQLRMLREVPAGEFVKALNKGVARNSSPQELQALEPAIAQFDQMIAALGTVQPGDVVDLDHEPGRGLVMRVNGTLRGDAVGSDGMFPALLRAFVGDKPYDDKLKAGLLGRRA